MKTQEEVAEDLLIQYNLLREEMGQPPAKRLSREAELLLGRLWVEIVELRSELNEIRPRIK